MEKPAQKEFPLSDRVTLLSATAPHPDRREVARRLEESKSLSFLIPEAEKLLDRPLSASQVSTLVYLHDYVGLSCAVILMAVEYCRSVGKPTVRAAEDVYKRQVVWLCSISILRLSTIVLMSKINFLSEAYNTDEIGRAHV